jgi:hypothetical protein
MEESLIDDKNFTEHNKEELLLRQVRCDAYYPFRDAFPLSLQRSSNGTTRQIENLKEVNKMKKEAKSMPGFDAESSLCPTRGKYWVAAGYSRYGSDFGRSAIVTQAFGGLAAINNSGTHTPPGPGGVVSPWSCEGGTCGCDSAVDCLLLAGNVRCGGWKCWPNAVGDISCTCTRY